MSFSVREVGENDLENLMNWRMSPEVTDFLFTDCYLTIEGQKKWFYSLKERKDQIRWMVDVDGIPAGTIYLESIDYTKKRTSWGYFIGVKTLRSIQLAVALELSLYDYVFNKMGFEEIYLLGMDCSYSIERHSDGSITRNDIRDYNHLIQQMEERQGMALPEEVRKHFGIFTEIDAIMDGYRAAKQHADLHGIRICNATRGGKLDIFPRADLDKVI